MPPDRDACLNLLERAGCPDGVVDHVQAVARLATALVELAPEADRAIVLAGALLHDIGRAFTNGPDHVPRGVAFLREQQVDEVVVRAVARHMGAGIEPAQARTFGWPPEDAYQPETLEEQIVAHADNLTAGTRYRDLDQVLEQLSGQGLEAVVPRMRALHEALQEVLGVDPDAVAASLSQG